MDKARSQASWASSYKLPCCVATDIQVVFTIEVLLCSMVMCEHGLLEH